MNYVRVLSRQVLNGICIYKHKQINAKKQLQSQTIANNKRISLVCDTEKNLTWQNLSKQSHWSELGVCVCVHIKWFDDIMTRNLKAFHCSNMTEVCGQSYSIMQMVLDPVVQAFRSISTSSEWSHRTQWPRFGSTTVMLMQWLPNGNSWHSEISCYTHYLCVLVEVKPWPNSAVL